jgi:tRNA threonylcarbamoyladenosine biosynthesis protein TsaB
MIVLAIDTTANLCAACVQETATGELGRSVRDLGKGHAEHLMAVIDDALAAAGKSYADLDRLAVAVGPGSFTGIRVGVSAARGLALALQIPAIGVTTLEALAFEARQANEGRSVLAALNGGRGEIHAALYGADGDRSGDGLRTCDARERNPHRHGGGCDQCGGGRSARRGWPAGDGRHCGLCHARTCQDRHRLAADTALSALG